MTGTAATRLGVLHTGTGNEAARYSASYGAFVDTPVRASHLALLTMHNVADVRAHLLGQDAIWVGGGSVVNLLAVSRAHGLDTLLTEAWEAGVVLAGVSAGSLCWHRGGTTDSFGRELRAVPDGLGLVPFSNCPHYDSEERRRPLYQRLVVTGELPPGFAADDGVALHYVGLDLADAVSDRPTGAAWRVQPAPTGGVVETRIDPRRLPGGP